MANWSRDAMIAERGIGGLATGAVIVLLGRGMRTPLCDSDDRHGALISM